MKVFLGSRCNGSRWRDKLIPMLKIDYFNPVVENWTAERQAVEIQQREICDFVLYVITPLMTGYYAIAEAVEDSIKRPEKTIFCALYQDRNENENIVWTRAQCSSLSAVCAMIARNGGKLCDDLQDVANYLNNMVI